MDLDEEMLQHCVVAQLSGHNTLKKSFCELPNLPVVFKERLERVLKRKTPAWQDDMLIVKQASEDEC